MLEIRKKIQVVLMANAGQSRATGPLFILKTGCPNEVLVVSGTRATANFGHWYWRLVSTEKVKPHSTFFTQTRVIYTLSLFLTEFIKLYEGHRQVLQRKIPREIAWLWEVEDSIFQWKLTTGYSSFCNRLNRFWMKSWRSCQTSLTCRKWCLVLKIVHLTL